MALLEIQNLTVEFASEHRFLKAVSNISFSLKRGETLGIVGESGSGKSVTALSIMRLIPEPPGKISNGQILFHPSEGRKSDLLKLPEKEIRLYRGSQIAMIFQEPMTSLNPVQTCGAQVMEAIRLHRKANKKEAKQITIELFKEVQLPRPKEIFKSYPHQISGGQKQRVMIAMAISCNPAILIADEPTTALDVTVQKTILQLMKKLQQKYNMSIIFITHDLGVVAEIADRVIVMFKGEIVETGPVKQLFTNPQHPYTQGLLACRPPLSKRISRLPTISDFLNQNSQANRDEGLDVGFGRDEFTISQRERKKRLKKLYRQEPLLQLTNVKTYFPFHKGFFGKVKEHVHAVDDINLNVYPGETLGLVGESGCGKTTLGRTILRLTEPTEGTVFYKGKSITNMNSVELRMLRKELQIIFQDPYSSLNPRLTAGKAIMEPMKVFGLYENEKIRKQKTMELLEKVNLSADHFYRYPHEFSGGQRQRICIARALALEPQFIICDESVSALDVSIQAQVLNLLNNLKEEFNFTYIFISHDLSVVKFMSDRIAVMKQGKILEIGDADEVYHHPSTDYTRELINAIPVGY